MLPRFAMKGITVEVRYYSLAEAAHMCPNRPSTAVVWRWCRKGILSRSGKRIKLEHRRIGGRLFVPKGALEAFFRRLTESDNDHFDKQRPVPSPRTRTSSQRHRQIEQAKNALERAGI